MQAQMKFQFCYCLNITNNLMNLHKNSKKKKDLLDFVLVKQLVEIHLPFWKMKLMYSYDLITLGCLLPSLLRVL